MVGGRQAVRAASRSLRHLGGGNYVGLKRLLAVPVAAGTDRCTVGHGIPFRAVAGPPLLAEGETEATRLGTTDWMVARLTIDDLERFGGAAP